MITAVACWIAPGHSATPEPGVQVVSSSPSRLVFQVRADDFRIDASPILEGAERLSISGYYPRGGQGQPGKPAQKFLIGLPPEGAYSLKWRILGAERLGQHVLEPMPYLESRRGGDLGILTSERYAIDPTVYNESKISAGVVAGRVAYIRRQRVLPVWVEPLTYDPATGEASLATSIEIEITFRGGSGPGLTDERKTDGRPSESAEWERMFSRLLVNADIAASWRPAPRIREDVPLRMEAPARVGELIKIKVRETGIHKIKASTLIAAGFPAGQPPTDLHLFVRAYDDDALQETINDIGYFVREDPAGTAGVFDGNDALVFYALKLREDPSAGDTVEQYADFNVYWLGLTSGPAMSDRVLAPGFLTADTLTASFPVFAHFEIDRVFREQTPQGFKDFYVYNTGSYTGYNETRVDLPLEFDTVKPGTVLHLEAQFFGQQSGVVNSLLISLDNAVGTTTLQAGFPVPHKNMVMFQNDVPAAVTAAGDNTFRFETNPAGGLIRVLLNWVVVSYEALYRARANTLYFNTASLAGDTSLTVTGLTSTDVYLFDVTDPAAPVNCQLTPGLFTSLGGSYALTFRETISARKNYVVIPLDQMTEIGGADVALDAGSSLIGGPAESGVDILVISHRNFISGMGEWVRYREAQGYGVLMADAEDVYDEFNNGVPGARGISRFIRHFFELGNAGFVLLVGDASEDSKGLSADSPPNFIPTYAHSESIGSPFFTDEVVTTDKLYVKLPNAGGTIDAYPDMAIGRFPVGNTNELQVVLSKIFRYERPQASDFWRRRMIMIADDAYSSGTDPGMIEEKSGEGRFQSGQEYAAQIIDEAFPVGGYDVVRFYLKAYTDVFHPPPADAQLYRTQQYTRANVTPVLMDQLKQGATLVAIQAHMNRFQLCHEKILVTEGNTLGSTPNRDHLRMENRDKPFIFFGFGCHFTDYALHEENSQFNRNVNSPNGDAFGEQLLLQPNGAVATYGSSGFEYLGQTNIFMINMTRVWFYDRPQDTKVQQTLGHWILGQLMYLTESAAIDSSRSEETAPVERYHLLGDPLLRIDAGPPRFDVTVDGVDVQTGDEIKSSSAGDSISVVALVGDENAIDGFELWIDGADKTQDLTVAVNKDESLPVARGYRVSFRHQIIQTSGAYDIVLRAFQAPDTTSNEYHMKAEFVLKVTSSALLFANGRPVNDGESVPARADYRIELSLPVVIDPSEIGVSVDGDPVAGLSVAAPEPSDSTYWVLAFSKSLASGRHTIVVSAAGNEITFVVVVSTQMGLKRVINYPNPFTEGTYFVYTNDVEITDGTVDVYTVSGKKLIRLFIPPDARNPGENAVYWDGRDFAGDEVGNGVYLFVVRVKQRGEDSISRGKLARIK